MLVHSTVYVCNCDLKVRCSLRDINNCQIPAKFFNTPHLQQPHLSDKYMCMYICICISCCVSHRKLLHLHADSTCLSTSR